MFSIYHIILVFLAKNSRMSNIIVFVVLADVFCFVFSGVYEHTSPQGDFMDVINYQIINAKAQTHAGIYAIQYISGAPFSSAITRLIVRSKSQPLSLKCLVMCKIYALDV